MTRRPFSHCGFMLDSVRHFMPVEDIKTMIKGARTAGANRLHWHLTDDQGWRIEIKKYPKLTEIGSRRGDSYFGGVSVTVNNSGFYTQDEIREIVRFAGENGMEVIPEIEIPGHASALLAAYPEFGCIRNGGEPWEYSVERGPGIFRNLKCAGNDAAVLFLKDILDEVIALFPFRMIHLGGDEALKIHWRRCPLCRKKIREKGLKDEDDLQRHLILELGEYLKEKGREVIVWNDVLNGGLLPSHFIIQQWMDGEEQTKKFMECGGRIIYSDISTYYFDYPYGHSDIRKIFDAKRIPSFAEGHEENFLGLECPLWSERITDLRRASYLLFPRLTAVCLKSEDNGLSYDEFVDEIKIRQKRIDALGLAGAPEDMWDMDEKDAKTDVRADRDRINAPEAMDYVRWSKGLVLLERSERFMRELGIPEEFVIKAGDTYLDGLYGKETVSDGSGASELMRQISDVLDSRSSGPWKDIPEDIWMDTMRCFPRFISEYKRALGRYGFDRYSWTVRQVGCTLFRIGELEYELLDDGDKRCIALHIPSDARLESDLLNDSVRRARVFLSDYFPEWKDLPMTCHTWLLSPKMRYLLPDGSRILSFAEAFEIKEVYPDGIEAMQWVFDLPEDHLQDADLPSLKEDTTLRKNMKSMLLRGERPGTALGVLKNDFS
jgi:hexosaminidase